jgi:hypothetical protein
LNQQYKISEKRYAEAMKSALKYQNIFQAAQELHGMAMSLSGQKRYPKALRLNGAVSAKFEELEITVPGIWFWTKLIEKHIGGAIKVVGPEKAKILQEEGRQMGFEQAVEYALNFDKD